MAEERKDGDAAKPGSRQPYSAPVLLNWGTLRDLTLATGWSGSDDGGKGKAPKRTR